MKLLHKLYMILGSLLCDVYLICWNIRDRVSPPRTDAVLFVAHPDDDALFFHTVIQEKKPYVVLLFTGWSVRRLHDFFKAMKFYGVRCRAYPTVSSDAYYDERRRRKTERHVRHCLMLGRFSVILTHNATGEYGHSTHKLVYEAVMRQCADWKGLTVLCPVAGDVIKKYPLNDAQLESKRYIFEHIYTTETWVMTDEAAGTPIWFYHEKVEEVKDLWRN